MFYQGFLFALGFVVGTVLLCAALSTMLVAADRITRCLRRSYEMDESVDILRWQQRKLARETAHEDPRTAS